MEKGFKGSLFFIIAALAFFYSCKNKNVVEQQPVSSSPFVSLNNDSFIADGHFFYPLTVNFLVSLQAGDGKVWPTSSDSYFEGGRYKYVTKDSCLKELAYEMELIREMGFNSVRFVGAGEVKQNKEGDQFLSVRAFIGNERDTMLVLSDSIAYANYLNALDELVNIAGEAGLKVVFLTRVTPDSPPTELHLQKLVSYLKDNPAIMAYDLFNEPLYFDTPERTKPEVHAITKKWDDIVNRYAPNHLTTIGLTGMREIFEWDPNILAVDFISFHPYEYEPDQVRNEIYWYYKYVKKPWVIGETAIPADGDSIKYEAQTAFANKTLKQAWDCNAKGYSWWQFKDVKWAKYHSSYMGVVNRTGTTITAKGNPVGGTVKPVAAEFKNFDLGSKKDSCRCFSNYYNYSESTQYRLTGIITDEDDEPVEGAVIMAWSQDWLRLNHTVTKSDGSFELKADFQFHHWMASATNYSMTKDYVFPDQAVFENGVSRISLGTIKLTKQEFGD